MRGTAKSSASPHYGGALLIIKFKFALKWAAYASLGFFAYALAAEVPVVSYSVGAFLGGLIIKEIVLDAVDKALLRERREMQERSEVTAARIEDVDRKVSAIWNRIRAISGN
jgi:hypothetical protein